MPTSPSPEGPDTPSPGPPVSGDPSASAHEYSYGAADGTAADASTQPTGGPASAAPADPLTASAAIRPLPEGFAPPEGSPDPRRRRADRLESPSAPPRRRGLLIGLGIGALVVVLAIAATGVYLVVRSLSSDGDAPAGPATAAPSAGTSGQTVEIDGIAVTVSSLETALTAVGDTSHRVTPKAGEFIAVVLTVQNSSDRPLSWSRSMDLMTADGAEHPADAAASQAYVSGGQGAKIIGAGQSSEVVLVYDVPIGSTPQEGRITLPAANGGGTGSLPLG